MERTTEPWEMLADKKIWDMLGNTDKDLTQDYVRLLMIELFSRIRKLEMENYALQVILLETGLIQEDTYKEVLTAVKEFMQEHDEKKAEEVELFAKSGISFVDWVNFVTKGKFHPAN